MNSNKNFVEVIGSIFLICLIVVFCGVISVKGICVDTIKEVFISDEVQNKIMDAVYDEVPDLSSDQIASVADTIKNSEEIADFTEEYLNAMADGVKNNDYQAPDLEGKFDNLTGDIVNKVVNETGEELSSQQKANLEKQIELREEEIQDLINKNVESIIYGNNNAVSVIKVYNTCSSNVLKFVLILLIIVDMMVLFLAGKNKNVWLLSTGISSIISSFFVAMLIPQIISSIANVITNKYLGRTSTVELGSLKLYGVILAAIGILAIIGYIILGKTTSKPVRKH